MGAEQMKSFSIVAILGLLLTPAKPAMAQGIQVPVIVDGEAQIIPEFEDPEQWIRHDLWVETEFDTDGDGKLDRVHVGVTRPRQTEHQNLAGKLGADWVGATGDTPPGKLNCAIDFTPVWTPVVEAMKVLEKGGRLVINAIRKEEKDKEALMKLDYPTHIWLEKEIKSVANITRADAEDFLPLAAEIPIVPEVQEFKLREANEALNILKQGKIQGAGVLKISE